MTAISSRTPWSNPDNYFSRTKQVAFNTTNVVPGIDFSNDPLLQGRNFSYLDTQLSRLGSPNFHELPINRPVCPFSNNQRDAQMRHTINKGRVAYAPVSLDGHSPDEATPGGKEGYVSYPARVEGNKVRERSPSFGDHRGQAKLFWNSQTPREKEHIVKALQFELSKVESKEVRQRMLGYLEKINDMLHAQVALASGEKPKTSRQTGTPDGTADSPAETQVLADAMSETTASGGLQRTKGLSMEEDQPKSAKGRMVAILVALGVAADQVAAMQKALKADDALGIVVGPHLGEIEGTGGSVEAKKTLANMSSVHFDAVYVPPGGGESVQTLMHLGDAIHFIDEADQHGKAIAAAAEGVELVKGTGTGGLISGRGGMPGAGLFLADGGVDDMAKEFIQAIAQHRFHNRKPDMVVA